MSAFQEEDGGWLSRKLHFGVFSVCIVGFGWLLTGRWPALQGQYMTMVGGVTGLYALFVGANIGSKWVIGNNVAKAGVPIPVDDGDIVPEPAKPVAKAAVKPGGASADFD